MPVSPVVPYYCPNCLCPKCTAKRQPTYEPPPVRPPSTEPALVDAPKKRRSRVPKI